MNVGIVCYASIGGSGIIATEPWRTESLHRVSAALTHGLADRLSGADLSIEVGAGAVQSIPMPSPEVAVDAARAAREAGVRIGCFRPPSVPDGISRLRLTARATLTDDEIDMACTVLADVIEARL